MSVFPVLVTSSLKVAEYPSWASGSELRDHCILGADSTRSDCVSLISIPSPDITRVIAGSEPAGSEMGIVTRHDNVDDCPGESEVGPVHVEDHSSFGTSR